jgi:hypothetical protein
MGPAIRIRIAPPEPEASRRGCPARDQAEQRGGLESERDEQMTRVRSTERVEMGATRADLSLGVGPEMAVGSAAALGGRSPPPAHKTSPTRTRGSTTTSAAKFFECKSAKCEVVLYYGTTASSIIHQLLKPPSRSTAVVYPILKRKIRIKSFISVEIRSLHMETVFCSAHRCTKTRAMFSAWPNLAASQEIKNSYLQGFMMPIC